MLRLARRLSSYRPADAGYTDLRERYLASELAPGDLLDELNTVIRTALVTRDLDELIESEPQLANALGIDGAVFDPLIQSAHEAMFNNAIRSTTASILFSSTRSSFDFATLHTFVCSHTNHPSIKFDEVAPEVLRLYREVMNTRAGLTRINNIQRISAIFSGLSNQVGVTTARDALFDHNHTPNIHPIDLLLATAAARATFRVRDRRAVSGRHLLQNITQSGDIGQLGGTAGERIVLDELVTATIIDDDPELYVHTGKKWTRFRSDGLVLSTEGVLALLEIKTGNSRLTQPQRIGYAAAPGGKVWVAINDATASYCTDRTTITYGKDHLEIGQLPPLYTTLLKVQLPPLGFEHPWPDDTPAAAAHAYLETQPKWRDQRNALISVAASSGMVNGLDSYLAFTGLNAEMPALAEQVKRLQGKYNKRYAQLLDGLLNRVAVAWDMKEARTLCNDTVFHNTMLIDLSHRPESLLDVEHEGGYLAALTSRGIRDLISLNSSDYALANAHLDYRRETETLDASNESFALLNSIGQLFAASSAVDTAPPSSREIDTAQRAMRTFLRSAQSLADGDHENPSDVFIELLNTSRDELVEFDERTLQAIVPSDVASSMAGPRPIFPPEDLPTDPDQYRAVVLAMGLRTPLIYNFIDSSELNLSEVPMHLHETVQLGRAWARTVAGFVVLTECQEHAEPGLVRPAEPMAQVFDHVLTQVEAERAVLRELRPGYEFPPIYVAPGPEANGINLD